LFGAGVGLQQYAWRIEGSIKGFHVPDMMGYDNSCRVMCGMAYLRLNLSSSFVSSSRLLLGTGIAHLKTKSYVGRHDEEHYDGIKQWRLCDTSLSNTKRAVDYSQE
jgi:hypothetical protein